MKFYLNSCGDDAVSYHCVFPFSPLFLRLLVYGQVCQGLFLDLFWNRVCWREQYFSTAFKMGSLSMVSGNLVLGPRLFPPFLPSPLGDNKTGISSLDSSAIISHFEFSLSSLPRELPFIFQNPSQVLSSVLSFSVPAPPWQGITLLAAFLQPDHTFTTFTRYVELFWLLIFMSSESSLSPGTIIFSKYSSGQKQIYK